MRSRFGMNLFLGQNAALQTKKIKWEFLDLKIFIYVYTCDMRRKMLTVVSFVPLYYYYYPFHNPKCSIWIVFNGFSWYSLKGVALFSFATISKEYFIVILAQVFMLNSTPYSIYHLQKKIFILPNSYTGMHHWSLLQPMTEFSLRYS
jgi:hypothetical protein